jgi:hypothetical protein
MDLPAKAARIGRRQFLGGQVDCRPPACERQAVTQHVGHFSARPLEAPLGDEVVLVRGGHDVG